MNLIEKILKVFGVGEKTANIVNIVTLTLLLSVGGVRVWDQLVKLANNINKIADAVDVLKANQDNLTTATVLMGIAYERNAESQNNIAKNAQNKVLVAREEKAIEQTNKAYLPQYTLSVDSSHIKRKGHISIKPMIR
jgi:hypothetical protein